MKTLPIWLIRLCWPSLFQRNKASIKTKIYNWKSCVKSCLYKQKYLFKGTNIYKSMKKDDICTMNALSIPSHKDYLQIASSSLVHWKWKKILLKSQLRNFLQRRYMSDYNDQLSHFSIFIFTELAPKPIQSISGGVCVSLCLSVPLRLIVDYAQTVRVSDFCHITYTIYFKFCNILLLPFTKIKSKINQLVKDFFRISNERTWVSEFAILARRKK